MAEKSCMNCRFRTTEKFHEDENDVIKKWFFRYGCEAYEDGKTIIKGYNIKKFKHTACEKWQGKNKRKKKKTGE